MKSTFRRFNHVDAIEWIVGLVGCVLLLHASVGIARCLLFPI